MQTTEQKQKIIAMSDSVMAVGILVLLLLQAL